jgi:hypothetical protein
MEEFETKQGLKHGCCLFPTLFKMYLDRTLQGRQRKYGSKGLQVRDNILYTLYFANDQTVITKYIDDLSYMVRKLQEAYEQRSLIINTKKSEYMIFGNNEKEDLPLKDAYISGVDKCKYFRVRLGKLGLDR